MVIWILLHFYLFYILMESGRGYKQTRCKSAGIDYFQLMFVWGRS